jgi:hypothetical protein
MFRDFTFWLWRFYILAMAELHSCAGHSIRSDHEETVLLQLCFVKVLLMSQARHTKCALA